MQKGIMLLNEVEIIGEDTEAIFSEIYTEGGGVLPNSFQECVSHDNGVFAVDPSANGNRKRNKGAVAFIPLLSRT